MTGVESVSGVSGIAFATASPGATPAQVHGGPASPVHAQQLWPSPWTYPWAYQAGIPAPGAAGVTPGLPADQAVPGLPAGNDPYAYANPEATGSHGAPWPKFGTSDLSVNDRDVAARQQAQNSLNRGVDAGDAERFQTAPDYAAKMPWGFEAELVSAGQTILQPVPPQMQGQVGRDRVQGTPPLNEYGFDSAHVTRPRAGGHVPGGYLWLRGAQRPMVVQKPGRNTYPVGSGSYFEGQRAGAGSVDAAVLAGLPAAYSPPPLPPTGDTLGAAAAAPVWSSW